MAIVFRRCTALGLAGRRSASSVASTCSATRSTVSESAAVQRTRLPSSLSSATTPVSVLCSCGGEGQQRRFSSGKGRKVGLYCGSFDPPTVGHLDIIERGMHICDHLIVGVAVNSSKKCVFTAEQRAKFVETSELWQSLYGTARLVVWQQILIFGCVAQWCGTRSQNQVLKYTHLMDWLLNMQRSMMFRF